MPMPPALENDLAYSSLRNERHTPAAPLPPNGPSPSMPVNIWLNMVLSTMASKSTAWLRALALASVGGLAPPVASAVSEAGPVWPASAGMLAISHHLDIGLDSAGGLDRLQDRDHVERADAERVESVDQLLQRHAFLDQRELLAVLLHADLGTRHHHGAAARERRRLAHLRGFGHRDGQVPLRHRD